MLDTAADPASNFRGLRFDAIAAYGNGSYTNYDRARRQFPRLRLLEIDVRGDGIGNAGDFEPGDMSYDHAGRWAKGRISAGVWRPVLYFSASHWREIMSSLADAGIARQEVRIWTAHYTGTEHLCSSACGFGINGTADATQWGSTDHPETLPAIYDHRDVDVSVTADDFWGATPPAPPFERLLKVGSTGHAVEKWQRRMARRGWHIAVSGTYDASSEAICKAFQAEKGLAVTGRVNRQTWKATWATPITA
jgi:peptidoglycan hydrolase-like protein with peptidoglycan-binding domain